MWFLTQFNCFHNPDSWFQKLWEQTQYLHFKVPTFTTVWANYNGVVLHISRKKYGCFDSRKLITDLQNTPLIHSTLLVLHALFLLICRFALSKSLSTIYIPIPLSFSYFVQTRSLHTPQTSKPARWAVISASKKEYLAFLPHLTKPGWQERTY